MSDDRLPVASARVVWREARRSLGRRWWLLVALVVVLLVAATCGLVTPLALGVIVDAISAGTVGAPLVWSLGAAMAGAIVTGGAFAAAGVVIGSHLFETMLAELRERMVETAFTLPQSQVERAGTGDLIARAGDDVAAVAEAIPNVVPAFTGALFTIAVTLVGMAIIDPWYAVALAVIVPVHAIAVRWYLRRAPAVYAAERTAIADRAQHLLDSLHGLETVRAYRLGRHHAGRIATSSWAVVRWAMQTLAIQNTFFARLNLAECLGMAGLLVVGFALVTTGHGGIGGATAAMLLFLRLFDPINHLLFVIDELQSALASLGRIVGVIAAVPDTPAGTRTGRPGRVVPQEPSDAPATLAFRGVHHSYTPGHEVLHDITLRLRAGETVAVVGASGAGKSTLAALAAGVHRADEGDVVLPHEPGAIVLVTQEVHVFDGTLRENLTLARPGASDTELAVALETIGAAALLDDFADGFDTLVGAESASVTPSQAQQLALARVHLAGPRLVILDEATSEAGSTDAGRLDNAAAAVLEGRTALVVAHRLSQAATADRIVVLDRGRLVEQGTHAELLVVDGEYARLWAAWSRAH